MIPYNWVWLTRQTGVGVQKRGRKERTRRELEQKVVKALEVLKKREKDEGRMLGWGSRENSTRFEID